MELRASFVLRVILIGVLLTGCGATGSAIGRRVDGWIETQMREQQIPGLSVAVIQGGTVRRLRGYGVADLENGVPATADTVYQSGSVGKQFTAALILKLAEEGRLSLDDRLGHFFPHGPPFWNEITIRQLLCHTSGLPDYGDDDLDARKDYTHAQLVDVFARMHPLFAPGTSWSYSNIGYVLLGFIAEQVGGASYHQLVEQRIFAPLGMKTARGIDEAAIIPHRAAGYERRDGHLVNQTWVSPSFNQTADGSLYFAARDLVRWNAALRAHGLLSPRSDEAMWTPVVLPSGHAVPYGMGWYVGRYGSKRVIQHPGHWQGFSVAIFRDLTDDLTVAVLANVAGLDTLRMVRTIAAFYQPELAEPLRTAVPVRPDQLARYAGAYAFSPGTVISLRAVANGLQATVKGPLLDATDQTFVLQPTANSAFFYRPFDWYVTFRTAANGRRILVLHRVGGEFEAPRTD